jgi:uncharacterized protein
MLSPDLLSTVVIALVALLIGLAKGGLGNALGALVTPMLALIMPAPLAIGTGLPLLVIGDLFAVRANWKQWDLRLTLRPIPGTIVGIIVGTALIGSLNPRTLQHIVGVMVLLYCVYKVLERRFRSAIRTGEVPPYQDHAFGVAAGVASALGNAGGPIHTVYMLMHTLKPQTFVATAALYFALLNMLKLPGYLLAGVLTPESALRVIWSAPLVFIGVYAAKALSRRVDVSTFETIILTVLAAMAVFLLVKPA